MEAAGPQGSRVRTANTCTSPSASHIAVTLGSKSKGRETWASWGGVSLKEERRLIQQLFLECLLCARYCCRHDCIQSMQSSCLPSTAHHWPKPERQLLRKIERGVSQG